MVMLPGMAAGKIIGRDKERNVGYGGSGRGNN